MYHDGMQPNGTKANGHTNGVTTSPLDVIIVGAGIGGLAAAIALRQQGHNVTILESSKFSNETGAAIHMAPNANGLLRRMGIYIEKIGANTMDGLDSYEAKTGERLIHQDLRGPNSIWQHPWHLVHRAHLHTCLKEHAIGEGKGKPANLKLSSRVAAVDAEKAKITLESGEVLSGDVVLGADGVHSVCRKALPGGEKYTGYDCGHSAYRFLIPREEILADPRCAEFVKEDGYLVMAVSDDSRIVVYPCVNNTIANCLVIHPSADSQAKSAGGGWNQVGDKARMLEIASSRFSPSLIALLEKAPEDTLKLWTLLDMDVLPTWIHGRLALLGDSAHPFLPHQAQGGGQAIEDAVSIAALLPMGTKKDEIPERLELYLKCRQERANKIQDGTRMSGSTTKQLASTGKKYDPFAFTQYNFCHDEWDHSSHVLKTHLLSKHPYRYRQPLTFGPSPGPRQPKNALPDTLSMSAQNQTVNSIRFSTSRTHLQTLLPNARFSFSAPGTIAQASLICCELRNMTWLGNTGYNHCGLYLHGVQYTKRDGTTLHGTFLAMLFENLTDPIITGREEIAAPKWGCDIDVTQAGGATAPRTVTMGWRGTKFAELTWEGLRPEAPAGAAAPTPKPKPKPGPDNGMLMWRYVPAVGEPGKADAEYPVYEEFGNDGPIQKEEEEKEDQQPQQEQQQQQQASKFETKGTTTTTQVARSATISFFPGDWDCLPTIHHIAQGMADVPVYEILEATVKEVPQVGDVRGAKRVE